mmetsp:Transcript_81319/g.233682  ORF Transcript_81319/g.233682 Transcript_81319/m.233682 type:complete len:92 (-) Transcript_81319:286-561(-)
MLSEALLLASVHRDSKEAKPQSPARASPMAGADVWVAGGMLACPARPDSSAEQQRLPPLSPLSPLSALLLLLLLPCPLLGALALLAVRASL